MDRDETLHRAPNGDGLLNQHHVLLVIREPIVRGVNGTRDQNASINQPELVVQHREAPSMGTERGHFHSPLEELDHPRVLTGARRAAVLAAINDKAN